MKRWQHNKPEDNAPELRAVTFDVTYTLIHTPRAAEIYVEILGRHGIKAGIRQVRKEIPWVWKEFSCQAHPMADRFSFHPKGPKGWWHDFVDRLCRRLDLSPPTPFASAELFARFSRSDAWEIFPDVSLALSRLREKGLKLGIVSNWDTRLPDLLSELGLEDSFDAITFSAAEGIEKPNPKIFLACLAKLGVSPEHALHVGDHPIDDFEGAQAAGMASVLIDRKNDAGPDLYRLLEPFCQGRIPGSLRSSTSDRSGGRHVWT